MSRHIRRLAAGAVVAASLVASAPSAQALPPDVIIGCVGVTAGPHSYRVCRPW